MDSVIEMPPTIIVGAGRSGTNALRDALTLMPEFHTWPCDEINHIWRHGNRSRSTDDFAGHHANPEVTAFIRRAFNRRALHQPDAVLIEKTCANSLRPAFVNAVFPDARFVHIVRDARDVVSSAMPRWTAPLDIQYILQKARFVPPSDLPYYAVRYLRARLHRRGSEERQLSTWGPRFEGLDDLVRNGAPLHEICARQWLACVTTSRAQLGALESERVLSISYRDLAIDPVATLTTVAQFAGARPTPGDIQQAASTLHRGSVGAWAERLSDEAVASIDEICGTLQTDLGFI